MERAAALFSRREKDCIRIVSVRGIWRLGLAIATDPIVSELTSLHGVAGAARWSPDGRYIAFEFRPKEHSEIYLLKVDGGVPRLLATLPGADNGGPNWSRDGKWIYFYSDRGGGPFQIWKIQLRRRTSCPGNQKWRCVWNRICGRTLSLLLEA